MARSLACLVFSLALIEIHAAHFELVLEHQPPSIGSYSKRDVCNNRTVDLAPECWDELGITQYLDTWWSQHEVECNSDPYRGDGFASCYQQKLGILNSIAF